MNTNDAIEAFLLSRSSKELSPVTIRWYRGILYRFAELYPELPSKPENIEYFMTTLKAGCERKKGYYRALRAFYRHLHRRYQVTDIVSMVDPPKCRRKEPRWLTPEELYVLMNYCHPPLIKTAILFLIDTGARVGELATLTIDKLHETPWGYSAEIEGKTGKRQVPISYETYHAMLINWKWGHSAHWLTECISRAFKQAGVRGSAHALRHTFATLWDGEDSITLQRIMGHSRISTTLMYRHLRMKSMTEQHNKYSPLKMVRNLTMNMEL